MPTPPTPPPHLRVTQFPICPGCLIDAGQSAVWPPDDSHFLSEPRVDELICFVKRPTGVRREEGEEVGGGERRTGEVQGVEERC